MDDIIARMRQAPWDVRFDDVARVCEHLFGPPRQSGGSKAIDKLRESRHGD